MYSSLALPSTFYWRPATSPAANALQKQLADFKCDHSGSKKRAGSVSGSVVTTAWNK